MGGIFFDGETVWIYPESLILMISLPHTSKSITLNSWTSVPNLLQSKCGLLRNAHNAMQFCNLRLIKVCVYNRQPGLKTAPRGGGRRGSTTITPGPPGCMIGTRCGGGCTQPHNHNHHHHHHRIIYSAPTTSVGLRCITMSNIKMAKIKIVVKC